MSQDNETPEERRERVKQKELKHPASSMHESVLSDLIGDLGWKGTGLVILLLIMGSIMYAIFFR